MDGLKFRWDARKAADNLRKHGVSFEEAKTAFYDGFARVIADPEHSEGEARFILLGYSMAFRLLVVSHSYRDKEDEIRIISARKATKLERRQYEELIDER